MGQDKKRLVENTGHMTLVAEADSLYTLLLAFIYTFKNI